MTAEPWAVGVDLGGTKVEAALVDGRGRILARRKEATRMAAGPQGVAAQIAQLVGRLLETAGAPGAPRGLGVGVAGQVAADSGLVRFAPNLRWRDVPLKDMLQGPINLPVAVVNDVRAATWGEWLHGAGQGVDDLICLFVGTGIGGGVVSGGRLLSGCSNTAGELGHTTVLWGGPRCTCGHQGCLEALAGGWALARDARAVLATDPAAGTGLLSAAAELKGGPAGPEDVTAAAVSRAAQSGDPLARRLVDQVAQALIAGAVSLVNAFNPCRLILGGGVIEGLPELVDRVAAGVRQQALAAAASPLSVVRAQLHNEAGVIGEAALARQLFAS
jgi:glucokinase